LNLVPPKRRRFKKRAASSRGFTLVELVTVIILVGSVSALSAPSVIKLVRHEREEERVRSVGIAISHARALAMGRGSSVQVTIDSSTGLLSVREAVVGAAGGLGCDNGAAVGCHGTRWDDGGDLSQPVENLDFSDISGVVIAGPGGDTDQISLCFSPLGRTWVTTDADVIAPLATEVSFAKTNSNGIEHRVVVFPTGATRVIVTNTNP
jgi:prepilin-type N-terminal cleavage/methylation domain-containing protein